MHRFLPLSAFQNATHAVIATDEAGTVRLCNEAAATLLMRDPAAVRGIPCWKLARLRTLDGAPFCSRDCPVQRQARAGALEPAHRVALFVGRRRPVPIDLLSFVVPAPRSRRRALLHLLRPIDGDGAPPASRSRKRTAHPATLMQHLSRRELQILEALAGGLRTSAIADRLAIRPATVNNHIENLLRKLRLHRRLDAVLEFMRQRD